MLIIKLIHHSRISEVIIWKVNQNIYGKAKEKQTSDPMAPYIEGLVMTLEHGFKCVTKTSGVQSVPR